MLPHLGVLMNWWRFLKKEFGQIVITIFYDVDPTHVRKQTEHFGEVFRKTCEGKDNEKIETWKKALEDVATIAGYHYNSSAWVDDASMIEKIAFDVSNMLNDFTPSRDFENCIGLENHMEKLLPLLQLDSNEARMIGIWGPPGIGKTTIARFLFNKLSNHFQNSALMEDIKCSYPFPKLCFDEHKAKLQLQSDMISKMTNQRDIVVSHLGVAQQRLRNSKVLLILDDVDRSAQVDALAENVTWFGPGSLIIITTEDRRLLNERKINRIYKVDYPSTKEALEMFCMYAFQKKSPEEGFDKLAREITYIVGELPLGLQVIGSFFRGLCEDKEQWTMEVSRLRDNLNGDIERVLKFSYDVLCNEDKDLFLHIACFYASGVALRQVEAFLAPRFKDLRQKLYSLDKKSLISIKETGVEYIMMHKLLAQLGKKIVREELVRESPSRKHQFLNDYKNVCQMLTGKKITEICYEGNLRVAYDSGHPIMIFWREFPLTCLNFTNKWEFLVELHFPYSNLEKLWKGTKLLPNLKLLNLSSSYNLKELPNLSMATKLEELNLEICPSLVSLPQLPESLSNLYAKRCSSLEKLYCSSFGKAVNQLNFRDCFNLNKKARDLIIQTLTYGDVVLPGKEVPACFKYRASGSCLTVELNQKHLPSPTKFKACVLIVCKDERKNFIQHGESIAVLCNITSKQKNGITASTPYSNEIYDISRKHLYIFNIEAEEVTSTEVDFTFEVTNYNWRKEKITSGNWVIKECGVLPIHGAFCYEGSGGDIEEICERHQIIPFSLKVVLSFVVIVLFLILNSEKGLLSD